MERNISRFLPIDGFTYKTQYGNYVAQIANALDEIVDRSRKHRFDIELINQSSEGFPVRRLVLFARPDEMEKHPSELFRHINSWAFLPPDAADFLSSEWVFETAL